MDTRESSDRAYYGYEARKLTDFLIASGSKVVPGLEGGEDGSKIGHLAHQWGSVDADRNIEDILMKKGMTAEAFIKENKLPMGEHATLNDYMKDKIGPDGKVKDARKDGESDFELV